MEGFFCFWGVVAVVSGIAGGAVSERREAFAGGVILGLIFGPIGVLIAAHLDSRSLCPACRESVNRSAILCGHCRTALVWVDDKTWKTTPKIHPDSPLGKQLVERGIAIGVPRPQHQKSTPPPPPKPFGP